MRKRPSISAIFERDEIRDRKYTTFAIRCHGILEYSISLNEGYPENKQNPQFTDWDVTGWLVENKKFYDDNKHLSKRKTTKANQIAAIVDNVKESLDDLVSLTLVENMGPRPASRGNTITHAYRFTEQGYLLAWIIKSFGLENREKANDKIYSIVESNFKVNPSACDIFAWKLFKKFKDVGLFEYFFVEQLRKKLESNQNIQNMRQLLANFLFGNLDFDNDTNKSGRYWQLWEQTSNGRLDGKYYTFLHDIKLPLEKGMYLRSTNQSEYEKQRFENRSKSTKVILEGHCSNCHHLRFIDIHIPDYLRWSNFYFYHSHLNSNFPSHKKCEQCNKEYDILVPNARDLVLDIMNQDVVLGLDIIFEKKEKEFTEDADIYQDILRYYIFVLENKNNDLSFDYWKNLGYWLLDNNKKYLDLSKTAKNREETVENIQKSVKKK